MNKERNFKRLIYVLSVVVPVVVALMFEVNLEGYNTDFLPSIYASINGLTAVLLVFALLAIKQKNITLHKRIIKVCLSLSVIFLVLYIARHTTSSEVPFGDLNGDGIRSEAEKLKVGASLYMYLFFLITHIILSIIVIPFVLFAYMRGILNQVEKHKKIVRLAFPLWLYVAITGVIVYFMISPYY